jgi:hypothetical protein
MGLFRENRGQLPIEWDGRAPQLIRPTNRPIEQIEVISMSVSPISSAVPAATVPEVHKPAAAAASQPPAPSSPADTVVLSSAAHKASPAGDPDHDGH